MKLSLKNAAQPELFTFSFPARIYFEDTDAGGVVYHAQYLKFLERARTEWLRHLGFTHGELERKHKVRFVVSDVTLSFLKPAKLDDTIAINVNIETLGRVRAVFLQEIRRGEEVLLRAQVTIACLASEGMKPVEIPSEVKRKMEAAQNT